MNTLDSRFFSSSSCLYHQLLNFELYTIHSCDASCFFLFPCLSFGLHKMDVRGFPTALRYERRLVLLLVKCVLIHTREKEKRITRLRYSYIVVLCSGHQWHQWSLSPVVLVLAITGLLR